MFYLSEEFNLLHHIKLEKKKVVCTFHYLTLLVLFL